MKKLLIAFSGGLSSAYMTDRLLSFYSAEYDMKVVFANTGQENEETLEFVNNCDKRWGGVVVWVESVVHHKEKKSCTHRIVNFDSASRDGEPFEEVIKKYGIPNMDFPHCTRELKTNPINSFAKSIGWKKYLRAIGIRADEIDRMNSDKERLGYIYPMVNWGVTKQDVRRFWEGQDFTLQLKEHQGNCKWCWKKSLRKHLTLINENPFQYDFPGRMEKLYANAGAGPDGRVFFRDYMSTDDLLKLAKLPFEPFVESDEWKQIPMFDLLDMPGGGCSESCEAFA